jgi:hypothetical protein
VALLPPWTYGGDPAANAKDNVRFLIGDTNPRDQLLNDAEINYYLAEFNNVPLNAAIRCCEAIMAFYSRRPTEKIGNVTINFSEQIKGVQNLKEELRRRLAMTDASPFCGGISKSQKQSNLQNTDTIRPDFTKHMMENHQTSNTIDQSEFNGNSEQEDP